MTNEVRVATVDIHEAEIHLARLLARVEGGEDVVIARDGKPVARLAPLADERAKRRFGSLRGKIDVDDSFFEPLPEEELRGFE